MYTSKFTLMSLNLTNNKISSIQLLNPRDKTGSLSKMWYLLNTADIWIYFLFLNLCTWFKRKYAIYYCVKWQKKKKKVQGIIKSISKRKHIWHKNRWKECNAALLIWRTISFFFVVAVSSPDMLTKSLITGQTLSGASTGMSFLMASWKTQYTNFIIRQDHLVREGDGSHYSQSVPFREKAYAK